ncbi:MAG: hypothetical protein JXJ22_14260 [Bacteroidales bacterium]|nr:hypothetical protein [Bacteroidales bacterium]
MGLKSKRQIAKNIIYHNLWNVKKTPTKKTVIVCIPAAVKGCVEIAWSITAKWGSCRPVIFPTILNERMTGALKILFRCAGSGGRGGNNVKNSQAKNSRASDSIPLPCRGISAPPF